MRALKEAARGATGRDDADRGRRLRRAGRRRGDHPPRAGGRSRGRAAELSPPARRCSRARDARQGVVDTEFPVEDKFDHLPAPSRAAIARARRLGLRHRAGRLRQVLHLLRRALYARRRSLAAGRADRRRGRAARRRRRARDHADRPERQRLSRRGAGRPRLDARRGCSIALAEIPGIARLRYTTSHPRDMDDELIAAHRDLPALMPLSASAGAVGLRPHARGDEPPAHARRLSRRRRAAARGAARHRARRRISSSAFPARPSRISTTRSRWSTRSASPAPSRSNIRRGPARRPPTLDDQVAEDGEDRAPAAPAGADRPAAGTRSIARCVGRTFDVLFEKPGRHRRPDRRPLALSAAGACRWRRRR